MEVSSEPNSWTDELASLVGDTGIRFSGEAEVSYSTSAQSPEKVETESLKDQIKGFAEAWGELLLELGRGCRDVAQQTILSEDSYLVQKTKRPLSVVSERLRFLNEFLPEDRDPAHAWPVVFFVFLLALAVLNVNNKQDSETSMVKPVLLHPPRALKILLPDGRHMAYHELGAPADNARFTFITAHGFLSSRLGTFGIKESLLEEFGVQLISYDLPGFGESDPNPSRNLNSSALDLLNLAESVGVKGKFWVMGYSSGAMHTWAALKYIPEKIEGAAMFAPFVNPYDASMNREEMSRTWEIWTRKRKLLYYFAIRFTSFLNYFYRRTFLSGKHGPIDQWLSLSLGKKDKELVETEGFEQIWHRDVEESVRQGKSKPFIEEAALQVSNWGFSLADLRAQKKCRRTSILSFLHFIYGQPECELTGYLGPIHIWQGMDDKVVPSSMIDYIGRVLPNAIVHKLPDEGHFSYFALCDECHRKIFTTVLGNPQGPVDDHTVDNHTNNDEDEEEALVKPESSAS